MADPGYIVDGVLTDGEAWVGLGTTTVVGGSTTTVTFTSTDDGQVGDFSQYMDLVLIGYMRGDAAQTWEWMKGSLNGSTSGYDYQKLSGDGSSVSALSQSTQTALFFGVAPCASVASNIFGTFVAHFFDINSGKSKSWMTLNANDNDGSGEIYMNAGTWVNQAPVTSIASHVGASGAMNFVAGSSFSLFGVLPRMVA